jgi:hypothetical protein
VADKQPKKKAADSKATPRFDPKPVVVGGESFIDRIYPHRKKIGIFVVSGFLVWAAIAVFIHFRDAKLEKATDKLAAVLEAGNAPVREPGVAADPKSKEVTYADSKARANAILDAIAKQGTNAAGPTYRASLLVEAGKYDDAIAEYRKAQAQTGLDGVLAREGLGLAQEMKAMAEKDATAQHKGLEEALATFQAMQPDPAGPRYAFALYHQGRMLDLLGKEADAKTMLEKAKQDGKDPELSALIDARLASMGT